MSWKQRPCHPWRIWFFTGDRVFAFKTQWTYQWICEHWTMCSTELCLLCSFFCIDSSIIESASFKKIHSRISKKHDQTSTNLSNIFDFIGYASNCVAFDEIEWLCAFTKYTTQKTYNKDSIYLKELILTPFSLFYIKCKELNLKWKTSVNAILGHLRHWVFHIFQRLHSLIGVASWYLLEIWWIILQYLIQALCNI